MSIAYIILFFVAMSLLMVGIVVFSIMGAKRRTENMRQLAAELSFEFAAESDELLAHVGHFHLFSRGRSRKMHNVLVGTSSNTELAIFDYRYTTGSGKNSSTHHQTGISFRSDRLNLPNFELRPEHWFHKIGNLFGYDDIDFADYPRFSTMYLLKSDEEEAVRDIFTGQVIEHFEGQSGICAEGHADRLIVYRAGKRVKPADVRDFMAIGFGVFTVLANPET